MFILNGLQTALMGAGQVNSGNNITNSNPTDESTAIQGQAQTAVGELNFYNGLKQFTRLTQHLAAFRGLADAARGQGA